MKRTSKPEINDDYNNMPIYAPNSLKLIKDKNNLRCLKYLCRKEKISTKPSTLNFTISQYDYERDPTKQLPKVFPRLFA